MNAVTFSTNKNYQHYATALVKSLRQVFTELVVCRCINCDKEFINMLKRYDVVVIEDNVSLSKVKRLKNPIDTPILKNNNFNKNCLCDNEVTYTCHSRFYNAKYILENYNPNSLILMDCDSIVLNSFDELFNTGEDILIMDSVDCVHEDCIVIANTARSRMFIYNVIEELEKDLYFWDQDTIALKRGLSKVPNIKIGDLDLKYKDYTLLNSSSIWSGDGHAKYSPRFIKQVNKILLL